MWFFIGLVAGTIIGFLVSGILQMARKGDEIYEKAYAKRNNDPFDHFMPERRKGERRVSR
jgi:hypothetical protein